MEGGMYARSRLRGATPPISLAIRIVIVRSSYGAWVIRKNRNHTFAGSSVSIVGLYDGILTVQILRFYTTQVYGAYG